MAGNVTLKRDDDRATKPDDDDETKALRDAVTAIAKRVDKLVKAHEDGRRKDDDKRHDDGPITTHTTEELRAELRRREEEEEGETGDDDPDRQETDPAQTAADDDRRLPVRAADRYRGDSAENKLGQLQHEWDDVAMMHGERAWRPMDGEGPVAYDRRHARRFQKYSQRWNGMDLHKLPAKALANAAPEIRQDAVRAAYEPAPGSIPELREMRETDRTGRNICRFVGPVSCTLEPFRYPSFRVRRWNQPLIDATNFRLASQGR